VLAALPEGDGADLVRRLGAGVVVPPCDADALSRALEALARSASSGEESPAADPAALAPFGRRELARSLAAILDRTLRGESLADLPDAWQESQLIRGSTEVGLACRERGTR
jgi:hypothetical protein